MAPNAPGSPVSAVPALPVLTLTASGSSPSSRGPVSSPASSYKSSTDPPLAKCASSLPLLFPHQQTNPPTQVTVEIPAGLIDANETPEECAIRELYEETGYHGVVEPVGDAGERSCLMFNDPGMCNTNLHFVHVKVDLMDPRNENPKQQLEENEFIECFLVPLKALYQECRRLEAQGLAIDARVGSLAEGFEVARRWKFL